MSLEFICACIFGLFMLIGIVAAIVDFEAKKRNSNVRLPRHVSWDRAARYYHDTH